MPDYFIPRIYADDNTIYADDTTIYADDTAIYVDDTTIYCSIHTCDNFLNWQQLILSMTSVALLNGAKHR